MRWNYFLSGGIRNVLEKDISISSQIARELCHSSLSGAFETSTFSKFVISHFKGWPFMSIIISFHSMFYYVLGNAHSAVQWAKINSEGEFSKKVVVKIHWWVSTLFVSYLYNRWIHQRCCHAVKKIAHNSCTCLYNFQQFTNGLTLTWKLKNIIIIKTFHFFCKSSKITLQHRFSRDFS